MFFLAQLLGTEVYIPQHTHRHLATMTMDNDNPFLAASEPPSQGAAGHRGGSSSRSVNDFASRPARFILFSNELPSGGGGDDLPALFRRLHRRAKLPRHPVLAAFLRQGAGVLREEAQKQPRPLREAIPPFGDVVTLASHWAGALKNSRLGGAWEGALVCIYEIAVLIGFVFCPPIDLLNDLPIAHMSGIWGYQC